MATTMNDNHKEKNIREKLLKIDCSLSPAQIEGTAFLCAALVPSGKVYRESIDHTPSISQCYTALEEVQKTQPEAFNLLLYILTFVGCKKQRISELHQVMYKGQETAYMDIVDSLSDADKLKFNFFQLLYDINSDLPNKEKISLINLSVCYLNPNQSPNYTDSLFVHFKKLSEQAVISATDMVALYHWLTIMGKKTTLELIDNYYNDVRIPVLKRLGMDVPSSSTSNSSSVVDSKSTSATSVEEQGFAAATLDTSLPLDDSREGLVIGNTADPVQTITLERVNRGAPTEFSIEHGPVVKDNPRSGASGEREADVKISHLSRFSPKTSNIDTANLAWTFTSQTKKFNFTLESDSGEKLYTAVVEPGSLIVQPERGYKITVSAIAEGGQATISNLQPGISYIVVIEALNENGQCIESATATVPNTATDVLTTARKTHYRENGDATVRHSPQDNRKLYIRGAFFSILGVSFSVIFVTFLIAFFAYTFPLPNTVTYQSEIQGNNTVAFQTADVFIHRTVEVSPKETQNPVEIFSASGHCNRLHTSSRPYSYSWQQDASLMNTYSITSDYFAVGSELMFQANITAKVDRFNCSSAIYIFDDSNNYSKFLRSGSTNNFVGRLCFNLSRNGSYYNQVQTYSMKESSFLYIGLYLPPISIASHVDLSISGTQNFIVADLTSHCNLSSTKPTCKFTLSTNKGETSKEYVCILGRGSRSNTEEHVVKLKFITHFPNDKVVVILLSFSSLFLFCSAPFIFILALWIIYCCIKRCYCCKNCCKKYYFD